MPIAEIQLAGNPTRRAYMSNTTTKDRRLQACFVETADTPVTQDRALFVSKRAGLELLSTPSAGNSGTRIYHSPSTGDRYSAFGGTNSTVYETDVSGTNVTLGTITGTVSHISEIVLSGITYILFTSSDGTGWFWASDATDTIFTADTHSNTILDNITGLTGTLYPGMAISGSDIPAGARIATITSATAITITQAATSTNSAQPTAVALIAKQIDSDFPSNIIGAFAEMDGYVFIMTTTGRIYNSSLGVPYTWSASGYLPSNLQGRGVIRYGEILAGFYSNSVSFYQNAGYSPSPLVKLENGITTIGLKRPNSSSTIAAYCSGHGTVFWIGEDFNLYKLNGFQAEKITESPFTSSIVLNYLDAFSTMRKRFISLPSATEAGLWYDVDLNQFVYPTFGSVRGPIVGPDGTGICYSIDINNGSGKLYKISTDNQSVFTDDSVAYTMTIQTGRNYLNGGRPFTIKRIEEISDVQASGTTTLEISKDDYASFTTLGTFDQTLPNKVMHPHTYCKSHAILRLTHSAATTWRGQKLVVEYEPHAY